MLRLLLFACLLPAFVRAQPGPPVLTGAAAPAALRPALAAADAELADPLREARRGLPQVRKRYLAGLPEGAALFLTVRVPLADTAFRMVPVRVLGWRNGLVQALVPPAAASQGPAGEPTPLSFPEAAVLDWTIRHADGHEEGNYVGRYLETADRMQAMHLR